MTYDPDKDIRDSFATMYGTWGAAAKRPYDDYVEGVRASDGTVYLPLKDKLSCVYFVDKRVLSSMRGITAERVLREIVDRLLSQMAGRRAFAESFFSGAPIVIEMKQLKESAHEDKYSQGEYWELTARNLKPTEVAPAPLTLSELVLRYTRALGEDSDEAELLLEQMTDLAYGRTNTASQGLTGPEKSPVSQPESPESPELA